MLRLILYLIVASYIVYLHSQLNKYTGALAALLNGEAIQNVEGTWAIKCKEIIEVQHDGKSRKEFSLPEVSGIGP